MSSSLPTLLFCTSYMYGQASWQNRYRPWLEYYADVPLARSAAFMIDDASPYVPDDPRLCVLDALPDALDALPFHLFRFRERLGRGNALVEHWGWWRSFFFALSIARKYGLAKIVHVESDAFLLSPAIVDYINHLDSGWTTFWCPRYMVPEAALQVIVLDQFPAMQKLADVDVKVLATRLAEVSLPFTRIERGFAGNRYGEYRRRIPDYADYACQIDVSSIPVAFRVAAA